MVHKMEKNKTKTQHNMCWTALRANKHKQCKTTGGKGEPNIVFMGNSNMACCFPFVNKPIL